MTTQDIHARYLFLILGLLGILALTVSFVPSVNETLRSVLVEFAAAVFIAIILAFSIQRLTEEKFRREVDQALQLTRESVFDAVFSTLMPEAIFAEIRDLILRQPFFRRNVYATVTMNWEDNGTRDHIEFISTSAYDVMNMSTRTLGFKIQAQLSRPNDPKLSAHIKFLELAIGLDKYEGEQLEAWITEDDTHLTLHKEIVLDPNATQHIELRTWRLIESSDYYTLNMGYPTEDFTLVVNHPKDLIVKLRINHPSPERVRAFPGSDLLCGWKLEGGILPNQGLEIWWYPRDSQTTG
jgi:hypothetical protein